MEKKVVLDAWEAIEIIILSKKIWLNYVSSHHCIFFGFIPLKCGATIFSFFYIRSNKIRPTIWKMTILYSSRSVPLIYTKPTKILLATLHANVFTWSHPLRTYSTKSPHMHTSIWVPITPYMWAHCMNITSIHQSFPSFYMKLISIGPTRDPHARPFLRDCMRMFHSFSVSLSLIFINHNS